MKRHGLIPLMLVQSLLVCCGCKDGQPAGPAVPSPPPASPTHPADMEFLFLGLRDDQEKKIREEAPQSALGNLPRITTVQTLAYDEYLEARKAGKVWKQQRRGRWVYWAVQRLRSVHLPGGPTGMYEVTERYKAEVPEGG